MRSSALQNQHVEAQSWLDLALLLSAGLRTPADVSSWAGAEILGCSGAQLETLTDVIVACGDPSPDVRWIARCLLAHSNGGVRRAGVALVAREVQQLLHAGRIRAEEAFHRLELSVEQSDLSGPERALWSDIAQTIDEWPRNFVPYGEVTGELIPALLSSLVGPPDSARPA